jgi:polyisoprenoid-binding protein YceI
MSIDKKPHRGFTATTTLNRRDFGLVWGGNTAVADAVLVDDIKVELDIDAVQN